MSISRCCGALVLAAASFAQQNTGRVLTPEEVQKIDITVMPDGSGLPPGSGSVSAGADVFAKKCQGCHGAEGKGKPQDQLTGGVGTIASAKPVKTAVSYWPRATTLFDYIRRAMPINAPQSLTNDEVYSVTAYILSVDGVIGKEAILDAKSLAAVRMPNRNGFVSYWPMPSKGH